MCIYNNSILSNLGLRSSQLPLFCWCLVGGEPDKGVCEPEATLSKCYPNQQTLSSLFSSFNYDDDQNYKLNSSSRNQKVFLFSKKRKKSDVMFWGPFVCVD